MNELSLFTGAGGGVLGSILLGHKIVGYVEYEPYCQEILRQRIADGVLDAAPIFGDIRTFIEQGYPALFSGRVDLVTGGFPCQPFSVAGKGLGESDPRNMWPSTIECVRIIRPPYVFLENVPGLLTDKYMGRIFGDLAESGYSFRWTCLGADDVGGLHRRKRIWILAYSNTNGIRRNDGRPRIQKDASKRRVPSFNRAQGLSSTSTDTKFNRRDENKIYPNSNNESKRKSRPSWGPARVMPYPDASGRLWGFTDSDVHRRLDGMADWVDRLKAIGNGQVPLCMAYAFSVLSQGIIK